MDSKVHRRQRVIHWQVSLGELIIIVLLIPPLSDIAYKVFRAVKEALRQ